MEQAEENRGDGNGYGDDGDNDDRDRDRDRDGGGSGSRADDNDNDALFLKVLLIFSFYLNADRFFKLLNLEVKRRSTVDPTSSVHCLF